jgi:hypothetical protein
MNQIVLYKRHKSDILKKIFNISHNIKIIFMYATPMKINSTDIISLLNIIMLNNLKI